VLDLEMVLLVVEKEISVHTFAVVVACIAREGGLAAVDGRYVGK